MRTAAVYTAPPQWDAHDREHLVYAETQRALSCLAGSGCQTFVVSDSDVDAPLPGLVFAKPQTSVVALGRRAHVALADVSKRTLIACDLGLEETCEDAEGSVEQLVWSSINTARMVAVGEPAWQSIQLLPADGRRFYDAPPLPMHPADTEQPGILVIDHEGTARAFQLVEALEAARLNVKQIAVSPRQPAFGPQNPWRDTAWLHIHVGEHTLKTEQPRLIDSWHGGRLTIHLLDHDRSSRQDPSTPDLAINDQENGFLCSTPREVVEACRDVLSDPVLQHKFVAVGRSSVAPFLETWQSIAKDLLS